MTSLHPSGPAKRPPLTRSVQGSQAGLGPSSVSLSSPGPPSQPLLPAIVTGYVSSSAGRQGGPGVPQSARPLMGCWELEKCRRSAWYRGSFRRHPRFSVLDLEQGPASPGALPSLKWE